MSVKKDVKISNEQYAYNLNNKPMKFPSVKDLSDKIDAYFDKCDKTHMPYCITGICLELDTTRQTLLSYEKCMEIEWLKRLDDVAKRAYVDTIQKAKLRCQNYAEIQLLNPACTKSPIGSIFALKNYGWADRQEIVTTNNNINVTLDDDDK